MEKLAAELEKLENDQALKGELEFENKVRDLMKHYDKTPRDFLQILAAIDPSITGAKAEVSTGTRAKRPMKTYKNRPTGEGVKTRAANNRTRMNGRKKQGKKAVKGGKQDKKKLPGKVVNIGSINPIKR